MPARRQTPVHDILEPPLPACISLRKITSTPHFETSYGSSHGYNGRALADKTRHFERTWHKQYPPTELLRRDTVAARGFDRLGPGRLYPRSSHVQDAIQDETALLGHPNIDNYPKMVAQGQVDTYDTLGNDDCLPVSQYSPIENYYEKGGSRAIPQGADPRDFRPSAGPTSRRSQTVEQARWTSRHTVEKPSDSGHIWNVKSQSYDSEYVSHFNNVDQLEALRTTRPLTAREFEKRTLQPLSRTLSELETRPATARTITHQTLWNMAGRGKSFVDLRPDPKPHPMDFDMRHHIPSYRRAMLQPVKYESMGIRSRGAVRKSDTERFWPKSAIPGDTFVDNATRDLNPLGGMSRRAVPVPT